MCRHIANVNFKVRKLDKSGGITSNFILCELIVIGYVILVMSVFVLTRVTMNVWYIVMQPTRLNVVKNDSDTWDYTNPNLGNLLFCIVNEVSSGI